MAIFGYARVSTRDQTLVSQDAQLRAAGCTKIYAEKVSGARSDRPELALLKRLDQGDVLIVTRLSAGSLNTGFAQYPRRCWQGWRRLQVPERRLGRHDEHGRLTLTVLGGLAEFERELIIARTGEGRTRAKARGVKFGRPSALTPHQRREAIAQTSEGA